MKSIARLRTGISWRLGGAGLLLLLGGCESPQTKAAHKIADALPRLLGPAQHYDVSVSGSAFGLARGHADAVHVVGQEVEIAPDATLDTLDVEAYGISFDTHARRLTHADDAAFTGTVGQGNLTRYVNAHDRSVPGLSVALRGTQIVMRVPVSAVGLHTAASVTGTLAPDPDRPACVDFVADKAGLGVLPIPASLVNDALRLVGPIFDLSSLRIPLVVTQTSVVNGAIVLRGTARLDSGQSVSHI